jgi:hypothetical protein
MCRVRKEIFEENVQQLKMRMTKNEETRLWANERLKEDFRVVVCSFEEIFELGVVVTAPVFDVDISLN